MEHFRFRANSISLVRYAAGFTLIELLVVLAIITIITTIAITSQSSFNKTLILKATQYDLALSIRSAQNFGIGNKASTVINAGYGVHLDTVTGGTVTIFADTYPLYDSSNCHGSSLIISGDPNAQPGNCKYDSGVGGDAVIQILSLGNKIIVSDLCALYDTTWRCSLSWVDVVFARPNADPFFATNYSSGYNNTITRVCFKLSSPQGGVRYIHILSTGNINTGASSCPI